MPSLSTSSSTNSRKTLQDALHLIRSRDYRSLAFASRTIHRAILAGRFPPSLSTELQAIESLGARRVAVRSSGSFEDAKSESWAGQFDSFLDVPPQAVAEAIKKCWASYFNSRALTYGPDRYGKGKTIRFAVIVQEMVRSTKSGVAFSCDPMDLDMSKVSIEGSRGTGSALVSGRITPERILADKKLGIVLRDPAGLSASTFFSLSEISTLATTVSRIEQLWMRPVDVEWAFARRELFILQCRPITRAMREVPPEEAGLPRIDKYELTFKVAGLRFLFADMLADGFMYLDPLFTSDRSARFSQYFSNRGMDMAARHGYEWLNREGGFRAYEHEFKRFHKKALVELESILRRSRLSERASSKFFRILSELFTHYSKMDSQFTSVPFLYRKERSIIKQNLNALSRFKDHARQWINEVALVNGSPYSRFVSRLAEEFDMSPALIELHSVEEIGGLFEGRVVADRELRARKLSYTLFARNGSKEYLSGWASLRFIAESAKQQRQATTLEVRGQVANAGHSKVRGRVRLINVDYSDLVGLSDAIQEMQRGEILVAEFTAPELLGACRKAKAIVTDIGGLLSHAAIVSRELGIPSLVGTHNATKVLRTGDLVTIDFVNGTVVKRERR
ncbi:MAG: hypothetical protein IPL77_07170 [Flavobacteriales bacterium]|nr:hypothetical protein [Flavobacteriales bacterium]